VNAGGPQQSNPLQYQQDVVKESGIESLGDMDKDAVAFQGDGCGREGEFQETSWSRRGHAFTPIKETVIALGVITTPSGNTQSATPPGFNFR
jgi:hypothetical protein